MSLEDSAVLLGAADASPLESTNSVFRFRPEDGPGSVLALPGAGRTNTGTSKPDELLSRAFDILFATVMLIAVAPALLLLVICLQFDSPGPILYVQRRVGRNGVLFPCIKLRTMVTDARERLDALLDSCPESRAEWEANHKLKEDPRVTKLGRLARLYSLDELPQLLNILAGHMSVVGPRPIVEEEVWRYGSNFSDYCSVRPGLTGLWQVSGRNDTTYEKRVVLDSEYAGQKNFWFDLQIIGRTVAVVAGARGAY